MTLRWLVPGLAIALVSVLVAAGAPGAAQDDIVPGRTVHERLAYGIYTCDEFQEPIDDRLGARTIHTHGDGLIHIHPEADTARTDLDLAAFAEQAGIDRTETGIATEDGFAWETCAGGPAEVVVLRWSSDALDSPPTVLRQPWDQIDLLDGGDVVTIAVLPAGTDPSSSTDQRYVPPWVEHLDDETGIGTEPIPVGEVSEEAYASYEHLLDEFDGSSGVLASIDDASELDRQLATIGFRGAGDGLTVVRGAATDVDMRELTDLPIVTHLMLVELSTTTEARRLLEAIGGPVEQQLTPPSHASRVPELAMVRRRDDAGRVVTTAAVQSGPRLGISSALGDADEDLLEALVLNATFGSDQVVNPAADIESLLDDPDAWPPWAEDERGPTRLPRLGDWWDAPYQVVICGEVLDPFPASDAGHGINSDGAGRIEISPRVPEATAAGATLALFGDAVGLEEVDGGFELPNGEQVTSCDGEPAQRVVVTEQRVYKDAHLADVAGYDLTGGVTIALMPADADLDDADLDPPEDGPTAGDRLPTGALEAALQPDPTASRFPRLLHPTDVIDQLGSSHHLIGNSKQPRVTVDDFLASLELPLDVAWRDVLARSRRTTSSVTPNSSQLDGAGLALLHLVDDGDAAQVAEALASAYGPPIDPSSMGIPADDADHTVRVVERSEGGQIGTATVVRIGRDVAVVVTYRPADPPVVQRAALLGAYSCHELSRL